ncbi:MAG: DUF1573 domain-containing protein [Flavobacteriales bacterium]|nr:DUF1573 domain-containing protein [Flavobacteriales bacterium]MCB9190674.1 DUF1573 domain-containing protein [Flavobacteriales bacterium]
MKNTFLALVALFTTTTFAVAQDQAASGAAFKFENETIDYGTIENGADGNREFKFTNVGTEPLLITNAKGSCGCTTPEWPKEPIAPGKSGVIKVHYDTKRTGNFTKTVTLTSNAVESTKILTIKGNVNAPKEEHHEGDGHDHSGHDH